MKQKDFEEFLAMILSSSASDRKDRIHQTALPSRFASPSSPHFDYLPYSHPHRHDSPHSSSSSGSDSNISVSTSHDASGAMVSLVESPQLPLFSSRPSQKVLLVPPAALFVSCDREDSSSEQTGAAPPSFTSHVRNPSSFRAVGSIPFTASSTFFVS